MDLRNIQRIIEANIGNLSLKHQYVGGEPTTYEFSGIQNTKKALHGLEEIDIFKDAIQQLKDSALYQTHTDKLKVAIEEFRKISETFDEVAYGCYYLKKVLDKSLSEISPNSISIKLPRIVDFDDMSKILLDLNKAITIPVVDKKINGKIKIEYVESGSIWLIVALGTPLAVGLIGSICWSSAVINKKRQEAKMFEEHVKTLELNNQNQKNLIDAQQKQLSLLLNAEASNIVNEYYKEINNEQIERLKLSIETLGRLILKGAEVHPALNSPEEVRNLFPDFKKLNLIESKIKSIGTGEV
jgi:hypothetical protein